MCFFTRGPICRHSALSSLQISNYKLMSFFRNAGKISYNGSDYHGRSFDPHLKEIQMNSKFRFTMNMVTVLVVFALSAVLAVPAFADEGVPPSEASEEAAPPAEEPVVEPQPEAATTDEVAPPEEPTVAELIEQ